MRFVVTLWAVVALLIIPQLSFAQTKPPETMTPAMGALSPMDKAFVGQFQSERNPAYGAEAVEFAIAPGDSGALVLNRYIFTDRAGRSQDLTTRVTLTPKDRGYLISGTDLQNEVFTVQLTAQGKYLDGLVYYKGSRPFSVKYWRK